MLLVCRDYVIFYAIVGAGLLAVTIGLREGIGLDLTRMIVVFAIIFAAWWTGIRHGKRVGQDITESQGMLAALLMTLLAAPLSFGFGWVILQLLPANIA